MTQERTFSIVKPDAMGKRHLGAILAHIQGEGLDIVAGRLTTLSQEEAAKFYEVHRERPFYGELVEYMTSGPVFVSVLEGKNAVVRYREMMGATDPAKADEGTIRARFGASIVENAVHGSDSVDNAKLEIGQFFPECL